MQINRIQTSQFSVWRGFSKTDIFWPCYFALGWWTIHTVWHIWSCFFLQPFQMYLGNGNSTGNRQLLAFLGYSSPCTTHRFISCLQTRFSQHQVFHLPPDLLFAALGKQSSGDGWGKRGLQNVHLTAPALWTVKQQVAVKMVTANNVIRPNSVFIWAKHCFSWRVSGSRQWF